VIRPATLLDVQHVMETMWKRGRKELSALGVDPVQWFTGWDRRIKRGEAVAFGTHAILGWDRESEHVVTTSFQASESFEDAGSQVTKALRREIPKLMKEQRVSVICTYSLCVEPEAPKWFRLLGLIEDPDYQGKKFGPYTMRRFIRRSNVRI
jgi:hypothetical protein